MNLGNDIYVYEWTHPFENNCNSFFIGGDVRALIDPGLGAFLPDLRKRMAEDGIDGDAIHYVINTHSHPDHFEGSASFAGNADIRIGMHRDAISFLHDIGEDMLSLYWPARKALFPGDVIFAQNIGRTDFPGGSGTLLKESILKLSRLDVDYFLPGHMGIIVGAEEVKRNFQFVIERILPYFA